VLKFLSIFIFTLLTISPVFGSIIVPADVVEGQDTERNFVGRKGHFEKTANGVNGYDDGSAATPVDGAGGATITTTCTRTTTTPLDGDGSLIITKDAADRRGEGCSLDFTIPSAMKAKVAQIEFDYQVASGTFAAGSSSTNSDVIAYIYDVTNSTLIEPSSLKLLSNSSTITDRFVANFQTSATGTNYRLMFHISTTSSSAWVLEIDSVKVKPSKYVYGTPITDWVSYTPTNLNTTNVSSNLGYWRRVGDSIEITGRTVWSGAGAGGQWTSALPSGLTFDTAKMNAATDGTTLGLFNYVDLGTNFRVGNVVYNNTTTVKFTADSSTDNLLGSGFASGDGLSYKIFAPITGWSSSSQVSDSYSGRDIIARYTTAAGQSIANASDVLIDFGTKDIDTTASVTTGGSWKFTAPTSGYYKVSGLIEFTNGGGWSNVGNEEAFVSLYKNGSSQYRIGSIQAQAAHGNYFAIPLATTIIQLNAGDYVDLRVYQSSGASLALLNSSIANWIAIEKTNPAATISSTEVVAASYKTDAAQSLTTAAIIKFEDKDFDTHNAYNTSTGVFTVPVSGFYDVSFSTFTIDTTTAQDFEFAIRKNSVVVARFHSGVYLTNRYSANGSYVVQAVAGETIDIYNTSNFAAGTLYNNASDNVFSIRRIK
jgi:hypothetical protein